METETSVIPSSARDESSLPGPEVTPAGPIVWLEQAMQPPPGMAGDTACSTCTMVKVVLTRVTVMGNNESGEDEWRFTAKIGNAEYSFPNPTGKYIIPGNAAFPYVFNINTTLVDTKVYLTDGQTVGIVFDVTAKELDTFSDDTSTAHGAQGFTIPVSAIWYNIIATGDTPVQFQFEISTRPASKYD